jgi:imidazole glycerol-phosphate synthase subunit HisH
VASSSSSPPHLYIIDYGSGNLRSVQKAFEHVGVRADVGSDPERVRSAAGLVLPGVGAFGPAMEQLRRLGLADAIKARVEAGVPFLGVCLGLQLLFEESEESPGVAGLGLLRGNVRLLPSGVKVPHIGWNQVEVMKEASLLEGIPDCSAFYFVHSYIVVPTRPADVLTVTDYGVTFTSGVEFENVTAFQFHPEKSSTLGLRVYQNFAKRVDGASSPAESAWGGDS